MNTPQTRRLAAFLGGLAVAASALTGCTSTPANTNQPNGTITPNSATMQPDGSDPRCQELSQQLDKIAANGQIVSDYAHKIADVNKISKSTIDSSEDLDLTNNSAMIWPGKVTMTSGGDLETRTEVIARSTLLDEPAQKHYRFGFECVTSKDVAEATEFVNGAKNDVIEGLDAWKQAEAAFSIANKTGLKEKVVESRTKEKHNMFWINGVIVDKDKLQESLDNDPDHKPVLIMPDARVPADPTTEPTLTW